MKCYCNPDQLMFHFGLSEDKAYYLDAALKHGTDLYDVVEAAVKARDAKLTGPVEETVYENGGKDIRIGEFEYAYSNGFEYSKNTVRDVKVSPDGHRLERYIRDTSYGELNHGPSVFYLPNGNIESYTVNSNYLGSDEVVSSEGIHFNPDRTFRGFCFWDEDGVLLGKLINIDEWCRKGQELIAAGYGASSEENVSKGREPDREKQRRTYRRLARSSKKRVRAISSIKIK